MNREQAAQEKLEICRAYRSLFFNEGGGLKSEAEAVLRDLEKITGWLVTSLPTSNDGAVDPYKAVAQVEKRRVYAHIKERLFLNIAGLKRIIED